ncbi:endonuclease/exonuclease/phosphatase family protein [Verrucosispora sioxanthis]|uniref:endonuclease/exonuclease/phosphatase family protein n=1 Tax=Verrucosispora sioxanthis TaxID=2499994 RepID=UPI001F18A339|nr:endonuclease/exonuclease/phosphatase family protein [Verrucosispora sioxanthis]
MSQRRLGTATLALGLVVLTDVLRVFLPSVITIFGQAASTPAELLGAFAVGWFVLALVAPALVARVGSATVGVAAVLVLGAARLSLTAAPGGRAQLWLASAGLLAGLVWLAATAARVAYPVPGLVLGMTASALGHALLGTYDLVWWQRWPAWVASVTVVAALLAAETVSGRVAARPVDDRPSPNRRGWLLVGPALLLGNMVALSPAVAISAMSYWYGEAGTAAPPPFALAPLGAAAPLFLLGALTPWHPRWRALPPVLLVAGALLFGYGPPTLLTVAILAGAAGLGGCLALASGGATPQPTGRSGTGPAYAAVGGMLVFAVAALVYYAAYDLGYPNQWVPAVVAALTGVVAMRGAAASDGHRPPRADRSPELPRGGWRCWPPSSPSPPPGCTGHGWWPATGPGRRSGCGWWRTTSGWVSASTAASTSPPWTGWSAGPTWWCSARWTGAGCSTVATTRWACSPPGWGCRTSSRRPPTRCGGRGAQPLAGAAGPNACAARRRRAHRGAGARRDGRFQRRRTPGRGEHHLQPPPGADPVVQARAVADFATGYADGAPLVVAGDLNTEPGDPAFTAFTDAGLVDALAAARPLPTSPADDPREQIDHVLVSPDLVAADAVAVPGTASDHLPVAVTLTLPDR